ncbi:hypothetical protein [Tabrizicola sp.]|jgi:hypothetical protein|uniref:hypothetical protein n=1 Tax=Tabrizicola sp. TaxID=2005166 RepID=UPI003D2E0B10
MQADGGPQRPRLSAGLVLGLSLALAGLLMALRLWWVEPASPNIVPKGWAALPFAAMLAFGLAVVIGLAVANRGRWRAVLWPRRSRVLGALALGFVTPIGVFSWLPWILGGMWLTLGLPALQEGQPSGFFLGLMLIGGASVLAYPLSCLIVAGVKSRIWRVAVFGLMFWAAYGGIILFQGNLRFAL